MSLQEDNPKTTQPAAGQNERKYWRSLEQIENPEAFEEVLGREFPEGITEAPDEVSRRGFLSAVAASVALAGMTSCRKPVTKILPFTKRPEGFKPGIAQHYASTITRAGFGIGVLVKSNGGRPTKVDGNPQHPSTAGGSDGQLQAELLQIYDPNRSRAARNPHSAQHAHDDHDDHGSHGGGHEVNVWDEMVDWLDSDAYADLLDEQGQGVHVVMPPTTSPTTLAAIERFKEGSFPMAQFHTWTPLNMDSELQGAEMAFGRPMLTHYEFGKADVVVTLDNDFLGSDGDSIRSSIQWGNRRAEAKDLNRLYAIESTYTGTGVAADHRFRTKSSEIPAVAFALAKELGVGVGSELEAALAPHSAAAFVKKGEKWLEVIAKDLQSAKGKSIVVAGATQPPVVHAIAHAINAKLNSFGETVTLTEVPPGIPSDCADQLKGLASAIGTGSCQTLIFIGTNPVYNAPADLRFADLLSKENPNRPKMTMHVGVYEDETAKLCDWHFPMTHDLESWGDARSVDGTVSMQQPLVAPLFGGVSALEFLAFLNQEEAGNASWEQLPLRRDTTFGYELVKQHWQDETGDPDFETRWWPEALHAGFVADTKYQAEAADVVAATIAPAVSSWKRTTGMEIVLRGCPKMGDGTYANNSWMAECPDSLTKLSWDNAALVSMATARELQVENGDMLSLRAGDHSIEVPAWILPGHADESVTVFLGWGRKLEHLKVAYGAGFDAYPLRTTYQPSVLTGVSVSKGSGSYTLVCTQEHGTMAGRDLVREATVAENKENERWAPMRSPLDQAAALKGKVEKDINNSLWEERGYDKGVKSQDEEVRKSPYQWGMVVDLNACHGCNACLIACVAENNIPMVGKIQVARNREMFWMRCDRYFTSTSEDNLEMAEDPQVATMPVSCVQCENAPCESVCPVGATMHSPEGLNDMVYNRCIGTRYCSNNCPYKVRRYNYLDYVGNSPDTRKMAFNPDVTVRSRGVMEKCTYCVQRINGARIEAKLKGTKIGDGENQISIAAACGQACPSKAITFGNIIEQGSEVARLRNSDLNYGLLSELNTKPRTTYLGRVRNPNPALS